MSRYLLVYLTLLFFATSLAVAGERGHGSEPTSSRERAPIEPSSSDLVLEEDPKVGEEFSKLVDTVEIELGMKRRVGETVQVNPN